jgi:hypothetical protein
MSVRLHVTLDPAGVGHTVCVTGSLAAAEVTVTAPQAAALLDALAAAEAKYTSRDIPFDLNGLTALWIPVSRGTEVHYTGPQRGLHVPISEIGFDAWPAGIGVYVRHPDVEVGRFLGFLSPEHLAAYRLPLLTLTADPSQT